MLLFQYLSIDSAVRISKFTEMGPKLEISSMSKTYREHLSMRQKTSPKSNNEVINLGTGSGITVLELAHLISKIVEEEGGPSTSQILFGPERKGDVRLSVSNNSGLEKYLDTANMTDLAAGIRELVRINLH